jgi:hypothetical protein
MDTTQYTNSGLNYNGFFLAKVSNKNRILDCVLTRNICFLLWRHQNLSLYQVHKEEKMELHGSWKRDFDVYERLKDLAIDLGSKEDAVSYPKGRRIASATFTPSGLVFTSGTGGGTGALTNDDGDVERGYEAGREAGAKHVVSLHWALDGFGTLNDVWYCVKCLNVTSAS